MQFANANRVGSGMTDNYLLFDMCDGGSGVPPKSKSRAPEKSVIWSRLLYACHL